MRGRRGGTDSPLSLFSFQDIITGISGIMILVVLMMVLDLLNRKILEHPPPQFPNVNIKEVRAEIGDLSRQAEGLSRKIKDREGVIQGLRNVHFAEIPKRQDKARDEKRSLDQRLAERRGQLKQAQDAERAANEKKHELGTRVAVLEGELAAAKPKAAPPEPNKDEIAITIRHGQRTTKTPIVAVCSGSGIKTKVLRQGSGIQTFPASKTAFLAWARKRKTAKEQFVLIIKPSASHYAQELVHAIRNAGFVVGHEPFEEQKTVVFPE